MVAFQSTAPDLVGAAALAPDAHLAASIPTPLTEVYERDIVAAQTVLVSVARNGGPGGKPSLMATVGGNGRFVAFASLATTLVANDRLGNADVFLRDMPPVPRLNPGALDFGSRAVGSPPRRRPPRRSSTPVGARCPCGPRRSPARRGPTTTSSPTRASGGSSIAGRVHGHGPVRTHAPWLEAGDARRPVRVRRVAPDRRASRLGIAGAAPDRSRHRAARDRRDRDRDGVPAEHAAAPVVAVRPHSDHARRQVGRPGPVPRPGACLPQRPHRPTRPPCRGSQPGRVPAHRHDHARDPAIGGPPGS